MDATTIKLGQVGRISLPGDPLDGARCKISEVCNGISKGDVCVILLQCVRTMPSGKELQIDAEAFIAE